MYIDIYIPDWYI